MRSTSPPGDLEEREGRKVMVIVTDGGRHHQREGLPRRARFRAVGQRLHLSGAGGTDHNDAGRNLGGEHALTTMALGTGGRVFQPTLGAAMDAAFSDIIKELRTQYLLAYYPKDVPLTKNRFHRLLVRVRRPDLRVTARNGYYGEAEHRRASYVKTRRKTRESRSRTNL